MTGNVWGLNTEDGLDSINDYNIVEAVGGEAVGIAPGTSGKVLTSTGASSSATFQAPGSLAFTPNLPVVATNGSGNIVGATTTGTGSTVVLQDAPTINTDLRVYKSGVGVAKLKLANSSNTVEVSVDGSGNLILESLGGAWQYHKVSGGNPLIVRDTGITATDIVDNGLNISQYVKTDGSKKLVSSATVSTGDLSGEVAVANGGTGVNTLPSGEFLVGDNTNPITTVGSTGTGNVVLDNSAFLTSPALSGPILYSPVGTDLVAGIVKSDGVFLSSGQVDLTTNVTGTLPIGKGGTGQTSFASGVIKSNGTALSSGLVDLTNQVTATLPVGSGGTGVTTSTGTGSVVLNTTPTFNGSVTSNKDDFDAFIATATSTNNAGYKCNNSSGTGFFYVDGSNVTHLAAHTGGSLSLDTNGGVRMTISNTGNVNLGSAYTSKKYLATDGSNNLIGNATVPVADISGTLPVSKGGTGQTSLNSGEFLKGNSTSGITSVGSTGSGLVVLQGAPTINSSISVYDSGAGDATLKLDNAGTFGQVYLENTTNDLILTAPSSKYVYLKSGANVAVVARDTGALGLNPSLYTSKKYLSTDGFAIVTGSNDVPTSDLNGVVAVTNGGTGQSTLSVGQYLKGNGTSGITSSATVPVADITGTLPVGKGGTGQTTLNSGEFLKGNSTSGITSVGSTGSGLVVLQGAPTINSSLSVYDSGAGDATLKLDNAGTFGQVYLENTTNDLILTAPSSKYVYLKSGANVAVVARDTGALGLNPSLYTSKKYLSTDGFAIVTGSNDVPTSDLNGVVAVTNGGTGQSTLSVGQYLKGNGVSGITSSATVPVADITGTLPVSKGGTGQTSLNSGEFLKGNSTSGITSVGSTGSGLVVLQGAPTINSSISVYDSGAGDATLKLDNAGTFGQVYLENTTNDLILTAPSSTKVFLKSGANTGVVVTSTGALSLNSSLYTSKKYLSTDGSATVTGTNTVATSDLSGQVAVANGGTGVDTTSQNFVFAGPTSGSGAPSFRALVGPDLPRIAPVIALSVTSASSGTYNKPANCLYVECYIIGGGGAGGGGKSAYAGSGGGSGGGYKFYSTASSISYTVGAGGTGVSGSPGNNGNNSTANDGVFSLTAPSGNGGGYISTAPGGSPASVTGAMRLEGAAGTTHAISVQVGGTGGAAFFGGSGKGSGSTGGNGVSGKLGSGGGGGTYGGSNTLGGNGGDGVFRVIEHYI